MTERLYVDQHGLHRLTAEYNSRGGTVRAHGPDLAVSTRSTSVDQVLARYVAASETATNPDILLLRIDRLLSALRDRYHDERVVTDGGRPVPTDGSDELYIRDGQFVITESDWMLAPLALRVELGGSEIALRITPERAATLGRDLQRAARHIRGDGRRDA